MKDTTRHFDKTFRACAAGLVIAANATDIFTLSGSATKIVAITHVDISGIATGNATQRIDFLIRSTLDTGGTSTLITPLPISTRPDPVATSTVRSYTANPTLGTLLGCVGSVYLGVGTSSTINIVSNGLAFDTSPLCLLTANDQFCVNLAGLSVATGLTMSIAITFDEVQL